MLEICRFSKLELNDFDREKSFESSLFKEVLGIEQACDATCKRFRKKNQGLFYRAKLFTKTLYLV